MKPTGDVTQSMITLSAYVTSGIESGYAENFKVGSRGLYTDDGKVIYGPQEVAIANFFRYEGYSDPDDNCILYLMETNDGRKGMLIDAYGVYADAEFSAFIRQVDNISKSKKNWCQIQQLGV